MADEIRVTRPGAATDDTTQVIRPTPTDPERQLPAEAQSTAGIPDYEAPEDARADIEATRARMSETINEIEGVLVRKKEEIQNRFDLTAPVRENPWPSMGIALGAGLVLGLLTGGDDDDDEDENGTRPPRYSTYGGTDWERRTEVLEERTRRLLAIARDQEDEIRRLRGKKKKRRDDESFSERVTHQLEDGYEDLTERASAARGKLDDLRESVAESLSTFLQDAFRQLKRRS